MTDLEISKALALAIGWTENRLDENGCLDPDVITEGALFGQDEAILVWVDGCFWRRFDYRAPSVIWPIAKRYDCFPSRWREEGWAVGFRLAVYDTPEKAVAMAVIGSAS